VYAQSYPQNLWIRKIKKPQIEARIILTHKGLSGIRVNKRRIVSGGIKNIIHKTLAANK